MPNNKKKHKNKKSSQGKQAEAQPLPNEPEPARIIPKGLQGKGELANIQISNPGAYLMSFSQGNRTKRYRFY
jgi:hypothetical protein